MAISSKSKMRDILKDPEACAIVDKYMPGFATDRAEAMKPVLGMKFNQLLQFPQCAIPDEAKEALCAELDALGK